MYTWNTAVDAIFFHTALSEVLGPYGMLAFLTVAGTLFGVTLVVLVGGVVDQLRARATKARRGVAGSTKTTQPAPIPAG